MRPFVHLHGHTSYSLLDAIARPKELAQRAKEQGSPALALTEHRTMASAIQHFLACKEAGIKPIFGLEQDETEDRLIHSRKERKELGHANYHLTLLARTKEGFKNLIKISSDASTVGYFDGKARTDLRTIRENGWGSGIICLTGCIASRFSRLLLEGRRDEALAWVKELQDTFDEVYLETQAHELPDQLMVNMAILSIHEETGLPLVITRDYHYLDPEDGPIHDIWVQLRKGMQPYGAHVFYLAPPGEIEQYCIRHGIPLEAMDNTVRIAEKCEDIDPTSPPRMPKFFADGRQSEEVALQVLAYRGLEDLIRTQHVPAREYVERLEKELWVIIRKGFAGYFLILQDLVKEARSRGIPIGPGRGSAAGSLVSYLLGITRIDPLRYNLLFERFLNPERTALPDIDIDVDAERRPEMIRYLMDRYGEGHVAQVSNVNTLGVKGAIKDVLRGLEYSPREAQVISDLVPLKFPDQSKVKLDEFLDVGRNPQDYLERFGGEERLERVRQQSIEFAKVLSHDPRIEGLIRKVEGLVRSYGIHASGVVISSDPLNEVIPIRASDGKGVAPVTQWDLRDTEAAGGLKLDLLGLYTLSVIRQATETAGMTLEDLDRIDLDDPKIYVPLQKGETHGLFQADGEAVTQIAKRLKPESFDEVIDLLSLARPGPMDAKMEDGRTMVDHYILAKQTGRLPEIHPDLKPILAPTKGTMIYQEQIMQICQRIAGYSLAQADNWRRAVGKKKHEEMPKLRAEFIEGALKQGYDEAFVTGLVDAMIKFAGYGFNRSHSAAYSNILMKTAYLKVYHPVDFMAALMSFDQGDLEKLKGHLAECQRLGVKVLPPDINTSKATFTVEGRDGERVIRYGIGGIKGVGPTALEEILSKQPYESLADFAARVSGQKVKRDVVERLILAGAFDWEDKNRYRLVNRYNFEIRRFKEVKKRVRSTDAVRLNEDEYNDLVKLNLERELIGIYISGHPTDGIDQDPLERLKPGRTVRVAGLIEKVKKHIDRNDRTMAFVTLDTRSGPMEAVIFAKLYKRLPKSFLKQGNIIVVQGEIDRKNGSLIVEEAAYPHQVQQLSPRLRPVKKSVAGF